MLIIGERINGMFPEVAAAILEGNKGFIRQLASDQIQDGAEALDISVGPVKGDAETHMKWLVETVSAATDVPLSIDSPHPAVIEAGVRAAKGKTIINSIKLSPEHKERLIPLAVEHDCDIICLLMSDKGIPADSAGKLEIAAEILTAALEAGIDANRIYFDPILLPVANAQKEVSEMFELMDHLRLFTNPSPHIIVGLSNLSQKAKYRSLLNRTFCAMAMSHGLDAAIIDPFDDKLISTVKTAGILLNKELYAPSYLKK